MPAILQYLFEMIACSGVFFFYYRLAMYNRSTHQLNRFFLLGSVIISMIIPLISVEIEIPRSAPSSDTIALLDVVNANSVMHHDELESNRSFFTWTNSALSIYIIITGLFLFVVGKEIYRLHHLANTLPNEKIDSIVIIYTDEKGAPFSWFKKIFWNININIHSSIGASIFRHEQVHVRQLHSADRLLMNIVTALLWFNPFFWLIRKELSTVHEFIADAETVDNGDAHKFSQMVLACSYPGHRFQSISHFNSSSIKRRISMLSTLKPRKIALLSRLFMLPLLLLLFAAFSVETQNTYSTNSKNLTVIIDAGHGGSSSGVVAPDGTVEKEFTLLLAQKIKQLNSFNDIRIILTRETDQLVPLADRVKLAVDEKADVFVSLHLSGGNTTRSGIDLIVSDKSSAFSGQSQLLGSIFSQELKKVYPVAPVIQQGRVGGGIWVLDAPSINYPSLLVECGNISNTKDREFIQSPENQEKVARQVLQALRTYADSKN